MQQNEQLRHQMRSSASKKMSERRCDAVTDSILKNISVIGTRKAAATTTPAKDVYQRTETVFKSEQGNSVVDDFADFQYYYPNQQSAHTHTHAAQVNGSPNPFDDFDDFVTASTSASASISPDPAAATAVSDKYDAFRGIDSLPAPDDAREPPAVPQDRISVWIKCLTTCKQLLQRTFNALIVGHGEDSAIEALQSEPGTAFIHDLHQLYLMTQRIGSAQRSMCLHSDHLSSLLTDVVMTWRPLNLLFNRVQNLPEASANDLPSVKSGSCNICLCESPPAVVLVNGTPYHQVCANLWTHCISPHLPHPI
jgi:hypothetical protein